MIKCDPRAKAKCPFKKMCCGDEEGYFVEGSECDKFNQEVLSPPPTNADRIRSMSDSELADFLCSLAYGGETPWSALFNRQFCDNCPTEEFTVIETGQKMSLHECAFTDGVCPHGGAVAWWLKQPADTATDTNVGSKLQSS